MLKPSEHTLRYTLVSNMKQLDENFEKYECKNYDGIVYLSLLFFSTVTNIQLPSDYSHCTAISFNRKGTVIQRWFYNTFRIIDYETLCKTTDIIQIRKVHSSGRVSLILCITFASECFMLRASSYTVLFAVHFCVCLHVREQILS